MSQAQLNLKKQEPISQGQWRTVFDDKTLSPMEKFKKVRHNAKVMENRALRREFQLNRSVGKNLSGMESPIR
jgi:hypothetical protein